MEQEQIKTGREMEEANKVQKGDRIAFYFFDIKTRKTIHSTGIVKHVNFVAGDRDKHLYGFDVETSGEIRSISWTQFKRIINPINNTKNLIP